MKAVLFVALLATLLALITTSYATTSSTPFDNLALITLDDPPVPVNRNVQRLRVFLSKNPYSVDRSISNRFFELIFNEIKTQIQPDCTLEPHYSLFAYDNISFTWIIWYGGTDAIDTTVCQVKLVAESQPIRQSLSTSTEFQALGFEITQALDIETQTRPNHCFNGIKDEGEINVDCGGDACNLKCLEHLSCVRETDCVQECFASICQFVASGVNITTMIAFLLAVFTAVFMF